VAKLSKRELLEELKKAQDQVVIMEAQETITDPYTGEKRPNVVLAVLEFLTQPIEEQKRQIKEWDDYYEAVKKTKAYKRWQMQKEAFAKNDMALVKRIAEVSRRAREEKREELTKPKGVDFYSLYYSDEYQHYLRLKHRVVSLKRQLGETDLVDIAEGIFQ
jgi:hypothetical protein